MTNELIFAMLFSFYAFLGLIGISIIVGIYYGILYIKKKREDKRRLKARINYYCALSREWRKNNPNLAQGRKD